MNNPQHLHYETIHAAYGRHYYDSYSMCYRHRFIMKSLFKGIDLNGCRIAELACGDGSNSRMLSEKAPSARFTGFDISSAACASFRRKVGGEAYEVDLAESMAWTSEPFDVCFVIGGLHHCISNLPMVFQNIARLLKPGGRLLLCEPNKGFALELARKLWYKHDKYFDERSERALSPDELLASAGEGFRQDNVIYIGGPAYFLVLNSLIFRLPLPVKACIAPPLLLLEQIYKQIQVPALQAAFVAQWTRM